MRYERPGHRSCTELSQPVAPRSRLSVRRASSRSPPPACSRRSAASSATARPPPRGPRPATCTCRRARTRTTCPRRGAASLQRAPRGPLIPACALPRALRAALLSLDARGRGPHSAESASLRDGHGAAPHFPGPCLGAFPPQQQPCAIVCAPPPGSQGVWCPLPGAGAMPAAAGAAPQGAPPAAVQLVAAPQFAPQYAFFHGPACVYGAAPAAAAMGGQAAHLHQRKLPLMPLPRRLAGGGGAGAGAAAGGATAAAPARDDSSGLQQ